MPTPSSIAIQVCASKRRYATRKGALTMASRRRKDDPDGPPLYPYKCKVCHRYHLTKRAPCSKKREPR